MNDSEFSEVISELNYSEDELRELSWFIEAQPRDDIVGEMDYAKDELLIRELNESVQARARAYAIEMYRMCDYPGGAAFSTAMSMAISNSNKYPNVDSKNVTELKEDLAQMREYLENKLGSRKPSIYKTCEDCKCSMQNIRAYSLEIRGCVIRKCVCFICYEKVVKDIIEGLLDKTMGNMDSTTKRLLEKASGKRKSKRAFDFSQENKK